MLHLRAHGPTLFPFTARISYPAPEVPNWDRVVRVAEDWLCPADQRDAIGGGRGRQNLEELLDAVTGERGDDHGVEAGMGSLTRAHVRVGVDQKDRHVIAVLIAQVRERRHAYRALAANRRDARRFVFLDDRQRAAQLKHDGSPIRVDFEQATRNRKP